MLLILFYIFQILCYAAAITFLLAGLFRGLKISEKFIEIIGKNKYIRIIYLLLAITGIIFAIFSRIGK